MTKKVRPSKKSSTNERTESLSNLDSYKIIYELLIEFDSNKIFEISVFDRDFLVVAENKFSNNNRTLFTFYFSLSNIMHNLIQFQDILFLEGFFKSKNDTVNYYIFYLKTDFIIIFSTTQLKKINNEKLIKLKNKILNSKFGI